MVALRNDHRVPALADERLDELARILALATGRMGTGKTGFDGEKRLDVSRETRLSVTTSNASTDCEVT